MDPNLFHLDGERLLEVLAGVVVASFLVERILALLFENKHFLNHIEGKGIKEVIAFIAGAFVAWYWDFDVFSTIFPKESTTFIGQMFTGAIIAGGSKASVKLFRDVMGFKSTSYIEFKEKEKAASGGTP